MLSAVNNALLKLKEDFKKEVISVFGEDWMDAYLFLLSLMLFESLVAGVSGEELASFYSKRVEQYAKDLDKAMANPEVLMDKLGQFVFGMDMIIRSREMDYIVKNSESPSKYEN
jgi:hypothetical protein